ncbi:MAG: DUF2878 domain-containing protein [Phycisphaerales bacterium]
MIIVRNAIAFNFGWWACVLGSAWDALWLGPVVVSAALVFHLLVNTPVNRRARELVMILGIAIVGVAIDAALFKSGVIVFPAAPIVSFGFVACWIAFWANFATTLNTSLRWLQPWLILALLLGGVFGPLTYRGGVALGALEFGDPPFLSWIALSIEWAIVLPLALLIASRVRRALRSDATEGTT